MGEYALETGGTVKITREGEHLYGQIGGQPQFELFPRSPTEFFLNAAQADIVCTKDAAGGITSLTLT